jgi:hypothetical protein
VPALSRNQENTTGILNWFITVNNILTDAFEVGYQIFNIINGLPGSQVFPTTPGVWETVSSAQPGQGGHFNVGSYYAYDNANSIGYKPSISESIGTHRINWRWKISSVAPYQMSYEDFEIVAESVGSTSDTYVTVEEIRAAGLTDETAFPDATILSSISLWQSMVDRICRQWFTPKTMIIKFDGNNTPVMPFGVPIISVEYLKINGSTTALDVNKYAVYTGGYPDNRRNPRIKLINTSGRDIFSDTFDGAMIFRKGVQNQEVKCTLGYVEDDMTTPLPIKRAMTKLVIEKLTKPIYLSADTTLPDSPPPVVGAILEEETDGHRIKYAQAGAAVASRSPYLSGITNDQEIIEILKMYRAPIGIATPTTDIYR